MSDLLHPSQLGEWAGCPKRAWFALDNATGRDVPNIAEWVGTAAHALSADRAMPEPPGVMTLFDSLTPTIAVARLQAERIANVLSASLAAFGLRRVASEIAVENAVVGGTLDMVLERDTPGRKRIIADLKTGQNVPFSAWLQLGSYFNAYMDSHPDAPADEVMVIHIPRKAPLEIAIENAARRDGVACGEAAMRFAGHVDELLREFTFDKVPATPGHSCYGCALDEQACAVKVLNA